LPINSSASAKVYGLQDADELIGKSINDRDSMLLKFIPDEHRTEFLQEQKRLVGAIYYREEGSRKAAVPLWFTEHTDPCEKDKIYWPVLVQYRFAPEEQNTIVMRVIYVDVSDWDAMAPPPRQPPQVLRLPALFREGRQLASYDHDLFLSYNSKDQEYVKELYQGLRDFGFKVWFDQTDLKGKSLVQELLDATSRSRILCFVVGKNQMGEWQKNAELQPHLKGHLFGKKPFLVLLLDDIDDPKTWTKSLPSALQSVFENVLYLQLPPLGGFREHLSSEMSSKFVVRAIKFIVNVIRDGT
jgi:hypothetical protein